MSKKVSVAMAVYNGEEYMRVQIDSILEQLQPQDELIASYDQCADRSWEILCEYQQKDARVKPIRNAHPGIIGNFQNAMEHATGDYIFICDQDDKWLPGKRDKVVAALEKSGADMVIHNGVNTDGQLKPIQEPFFTIWRIGNGKIKNLLKSRYSGCCMAFTARMKQFVLPIPPKVFGYDRWLGLAAEYFGRIEYLEDVLLLHRLHGDNATQTSSSSLGKLISSRVYLLWQLILRGWRKDVRERKHG